MKFKLDKKSLEIIILKNFKKDEKCISLSYIYDILYQYVVEHHNIEFDYGDLILIMNENFKHKIDKRYKNDNDMRNYFYVNINLDSLYLYFSDIININKVFRYQKIRNLLSA